VVWVLGFSRALEKPRGKKPNGHTIYKPYIIK
jgi:hypothetical protein